MPLACIVCATPLKPALGDAITPAGGVVFTSHGNYGSALYDPMDGDDSIAVVVCDPCLRDAATWGRVVRRRRHQPPAEYDVTLWDGT